MAASAVVKVLGDGVGVVAAKEMTVEEEFVFWHFNVLL